MIGGLAVVAFWRLPHGPFGSGPPRAGHSQEERGKKKKKERMKKKEKKRKKEKRRKERRLETDMGRLFRV